MTRKMMVQSSSRMIFPVKDTKFDADEKAKIEHDAKQDATDEGYKAPSKEGEEQDEAESKAVEEKVMIMMVGSA